MKCLEIVTLRSTAGEHTHIAGLFREIWQQAIDREPGAVRLYINTLVGSDFSLHILRERDQAQTEKSKLGVRLAHYLGEYGIVSHTLWSELTDPKT